MDEHVTAWLGAYHDGELHGRRLQQVEAHVAECPACRAELERMRAVSALLQECPAAEDLTPPDRFVAQVGLRLPRRPEQTRWQRALEVGWQLVPVGLIGAYAFVQAVLIVSCLVLIALQVGLGGEAAATWLSHSRWERMQASASRGLIDMGWAQVLNGLGAETDGVLPVALRLLGTVGWSIYLNVIVLVAIGLLYLSWLATCYARRRHRALGNADIDRASGVHHATA
jgi:anti-sigma factor RsiW